MGIFSWFNSKESNPSPSPPIYSPPSPAIQENEDEGVMTIRKGTYEYDKQHKPLADSGRVLEEGGKHEKYTSIPSIPVSGRFNSENMVKSEVGGGAVSGATSNPAVLVGLGATTLALLAIMKSSYYGDKLGVQKSMRYRIMAQFFTVTALVAGATYFATRRNGHNQSSSGSMFHKH
uniref:Hypoxia induced protein domain containing protein n=1 Tax=Haemonchus contortus TaxID=6289 RepID=U6NLH2_HAECO|nr:Hypoxia induced protein domain containing protein [Haemonchus contortus]